MARLSKRLEKRLQPALRFAPAWIGGTRHSAVFDGVESFCLFVGYPRSGHSLVGSLLDAHPQVVLAHELDALRYVAAHYGRNQLYWLILERDAAFTRAGRNWTEFDYSVPGGWQGRFEQLKVIGDKKGGSTTMRLQQRPALLERLRATVGADVRLIHVVRNPFDNIATMSRRNHQTLEWASDRYFALCETVDHVTRGVPRSVIVLRHEDLIADPRRSLSSLCDALGLSADDSYLTACAAVVNPSPHLSRLEVRWTPALLRSVERRIDGFGFLDGYAFHG